MWVVFNCNSVQFRIEMEVFGHNFERHLDQRFDVFVGERILVLSPGFHQLDGDSLIIVLLRAFIGVSLRSCSNFS